MIKRILYGILIVNLLLAVVSYSYVWYSNRTYSDEQIAEMFAPVTSKYGIKIVYRVDDTFFSPLQNSGLPAGPSKDSNVKPIEHRVLARYPEVLLKAFNKYPVKVIKQHLNAVHFAKDINQNGFRYSGSVDPYRKAIFLVDSGWKNEKKAMRTFHHEFSSLLLNQHPLILNPWLEQNADGFEYMVKIFKSWNDIKTTGKGSPKEYEKGFVTDYGQVSFENDFNEYSAMIFTYPEKFKKIMNQYPRVRGKFEVWLEFYRKVDPIFTEAYLLGPH